MICFIIQPKVVYNTTPIAKKSIMNKMNFFKCLPVCLRQILLILGKPKKQLNSTILEKLYFKFF